MRLTPSHLAGLTALVLFGVAATALAAPLTEKPKAENPVEKVRKALDEVIDLDLAGQPLSVAIEQLREETKINFVLDQVAIAQMGIDPMSAPVVTTKLSKVKARTALRNVLDQLNLTFVIVGEVVHISTEELAIHRQLRQRVSLDLNGTALQAALKQMAKDTGTNLLVDASRPRRRRTP
jgi:tRNA G37 N-methylase Trm5